VIVVAVAERSPVWEVFGGRKVGVVRLGKGVDDRDYRTFCGVTGAV